MTLTLKVGRKYRSRDGKVVQIVSKDETGTLPFRGSNGEQYSPTGGYLSQGGPYDGDLLTEIEEPMTDGWIAHYGGPCPIPEAKAGEYEIRLRDYPTDMGKTYPASSCEWVHLGCRTDIIAYRIIRKDSAERLEFVPPKEWENHASENLSAPQTVTDLQPHIERTNHADRQALLTLRLAAITLTKSGYPLGEMTDKACDHILTLIRH